MNSPNLQKEKKYKLWITIVSILVPVVVAGLFTVRIPDVPRLGFLPPIYASINAVTAVVLLIAVWQIKNGHKKAHQQLMQFAILLSVLFLLFYIAYHATADATKFGDTDHNGIVSEAENMAVGNYKYVYYFFLLTHIVLSIIVIPFVLITYARALLGKFVLHKKIARFTFPLWLYVATTGVIVYLMISPYYVS